MPICPWTGGVDLDMESSEGSGEQDPVNIVYGFDYSLGAAPSLEPLDNVYDTVLCSP